jgi:RimJ/RimL family protein N-acetyltransferase
VLRPLAEADLAPLVVLANDPEVAEKTARMPYPYTLADARAWFATLQDPKTLAYEWVFAIVRADDDAFFGAIGLVFAAHEPEAEIGYWLGRPYWNQGYMTEAVERMLRYAFETLGLERVRGGAFPNNPASLRVQQNCGMSLVGREMQPAPARGGDREVVVLAVRREDWSR